MAERSDKWLAMSGLAANLAVIVTIGAMWLIYQGEREDNRDLMRRELAVNILAIGHGETIASAERRTSAFMVDNYERYMLAYSGLGEDEGDGASAALLDEQARADFITLTDYYNDVLTCRASGNCDAGMIDSWFRDDLCAFTEFAQLIGWPELREQYGPDLGSQLVTFSKENCAT